MNIQLEQKKKKLKEGAEDENNFFAHHLEHLNELDQKELRNQQLKKEKYLKEKELRDNLLRISLERKARVALEQTTYKSEIAFSGDDFRKSEKTAQLDRLSKCLSPCPAAERPHWLRQPLARY